MMTDPEFSTGFWFGVTVSSIVAFALYAITDVGWNFGEFFSSYQTLLSALLAASAALVGGYVVVRQTRQARKLSDRQIAQIHWGARAILPIALSEMSDFCCVSMNTLFGMLPSKNLPDDDHVDFHALKRAPPIMPKVSAAALFQIQKTIETAPDEIAAKLAALLSVHQIQPARLKGIWDKIENPSSSFLIGRHNIESSISHAMGLHALVSNAFDYAKGNTRAIPELSNEQIYTAALSCRLPIEMTKYVAESINAEQSISRRVGVRMLK